MISAYVPRSVVTKSLAARLKTDNNCLWKRLSDMPELMPKQTPTKSYEVHLDKLSLPILLMLLVNNEGERFTKELDEMHSYVI